MKYSSERLKSMRKSAREVCSRWTPSFDSILISEFNLPRYILISPVSMKMNLSISQVVQSIGMDRFPPSANLDYAITCSGVLQSAIVQ